MVQVIAFLPLLISLLSLTDTAQAAAVVRKPSTRTGPVGRNETSLFRDPTQAQVQTADVEKRGYDGTSGNPWTNFRSFSWTPWTNSGLYDHSLEYVM